MMTPTICTNGGEQDFMHLELMHGHRNTAL